MAETACASSSSCRRHPFKGRSVAIINDLTLREQWYVYSKARELKEAIRNGENLDRFRLKNRESAVYTIFMEDSTRTKESFRNAAEFHGMKVNVFDSKTSSFTKNETITDTVKMLCGYSIGQSIFVIRSKIEGVCRWLEEAIGEYCLQRGFPRASFVNAGDGRHEHPSQELLDEFSFLEQKGWDTSSIHLALLGDLFHGRTVHSKVDGLRIYRRVFVDLIAPPELALPKQYEDKMRFFGFNVRKFASIDEYLEQPKVASIWYFTRLQMERMGDKVLDKCAQLRSAVTFRQDMVDRVPPDSKFFHPLPRDSRFPTLPFWLDNTKFNGWDQQSQNGYFARIVLLGMLGGHFGDDYELAETGSPREPRSPLLRPLPGSPVVDFGDDEMESGLLKNWDFIEEIDPSEKLVEGTSQEVGLGPISQGIVIQHLADGQSVEEIWGRMYMVRSILGLTNVGGQGVYRHGNPERFSGFISVPDVDIQHWDRQPLKKLAATAPGSILQVIQDGVIWKEFRLLVPPKVYNFRDISCKNTACVSHPSNLQHEVQPSFSRVPLLNGKNIVDLMTSGGDASAWAFTCKYCEARHSFWEIWDYKHYQTTELSH